VTSQLRAPEAEHALTPSDPRLDPSARPDVAKSKAFQERFEMKYWIPERLTPTITQFGHAYLRVDPFHDEHAMERNTSLYLDTANLDFYTAHVESAPDRAKLRVRVYGETPSASNRPSGMAFFEFKRKVRSVIVKRRAGVPADRVGAIVDGDYQSIPAKMRDGWPNSPMQKATVGTRLARISRISRRLSCGLWAIVTILTTSAFRFVKRACR